MTDQLTLNPSECLAPVISLMAELERLGITPASINVEWRFTNQTEPYLHVWLRYRTEFERLTKAMGLKTQQQTPVMGQRLYSTTGGAPCPLIQCMSFPHHDDWEGTV